MRLPHCNEIKGGTSKGLGALPSPPLLMIRSMIRWEMKEVYDFSRIIFVYISSHIHVCDFNLFNTINVLNINPLRNYEVKNSHIGVDSERKEKLI